MIHTIPLFQNTCAFYYFIATRLSSIESRRRKTRMRVRRGTVVPTETEAEEEAVAV